MNESFIGRFFDEMYSAILNMVQLQKEVVG